MVKLILDDSDLDNVVYTIIDDEDYEWVLQWNWSYTGKYAGRSEEVNGIKKRIYLHSAINNTPDGFDTDHINGDKLDNRKSNLRTATSLQNSRNRGITKANTSGFKGVSWNKNMKKYESYITVNYKKIKLGYYDDVKSAAEAYNKAAELYHGDYAALNEVPIG